MRAAIRLKLEMGTRVRDFLRNHSLDGTGLMAAVVWFETLLARALGHSSLQQEGLTTSRGNTKVRGTIKSRMREGVLRHLVGVAQVAARVRPELASLFQLPSAKIPHLTFMTLVGRMLVEAEANKELLVSKGLDENAIEVLRKDLAELAAVDAESHSARSKHVGARADLDAVTTEIMDQVKLLDGSVRYRFRDDPEVLAAWRSARNVPGPSVRTVEELPGVTSPQATPTPQVPPAAAA